MTALKAVMNPSLCISAKLRQCIEMHRHRVIQIIVFDCVLSIFCWLPDVSVKLNVHYDVISASIT